MLRSRLKLNKGITMEGIDRDFVCWNQIRTLISHQLSNLFLSFSFLGFMPKKIKFGRPPKENEDLEPSALIFE